MDAFWRASRLGFHTSTLADEDAFWAKCFRIILEDHGAKDAETLAAQLSERFCHYKIKEPYPETVMVLEALKSQGYSLGLIIDTSPSLEESLERAGIAHFFESFTCSALVGAGKPDPRIFNAALDSLGVVAGDSVFVDDCKEEADGARDQGFTAFRIVRERAEPDFADWTIGNLNHLLDFLDARWKGGQD
jgi:HAD superfamily hydrolase (TIGR01509 family)